METQETQISEKTKDLFKRLQYIPNAHIKTYEGKTRDQYIPVPEVPGGNKVTVESTDLKSAVTSLQRRVTALESKAAE